MTTVYLLWHTHETTQDTDDDKLIGVYSSKGNAQNAMLRLRDQRGFKDHQNRFEVREYVLDRNHWTEGFGPIGGNAEIKIHAGRKSMPPAVPEGRNRR